MASINPAHPLASAVVTLIGVDGDGNLQDFAAHQLTDAELAELKASLLAGPSVQFAAALGRLVS